MTTIGHTPLDGTTVTGTTHGDGSGPLLKAAGWRWARHATTWYLPRPLWIVLPRHLEPQHQPQQFGSLADRTNRSTEAPQPSGNPIRHAWLDGDIPVLLLRWRRTTEGGWEGQVLGAGPTGPATVWVIAQRLTPS